MSSSAPITLFALPYAGGNSLVYRKLKQLLEPEIHLVALEPPGRGKRMKEPLVTDINLIAKDLHAQIQSLSGEKGFALLGHSMGALLAYLIANIVATEMPNQLIHLFCSAHGAPSIPKGAQNDDNPRYKAPSEEFWAYIESLGALPPELKAHEELMSYFEPIVRADIQALECYTYQPLSEPLDVPTTVFYGMSDTETPVLDLLHWQREIAQPIEFIPQKGAHFAFFDELDAVAKHLRSRLITK